MALKLFCAFVCLVAAVKADAKEIPIVYQEMDLLPEGSFHWSYEGADGSKAAQEGALKSNGEEELLVQKGSYSYVGDDGLTYSVSYVADENGFQPVGDHLPIPPEVPGLIAGTVEYLSENQS